MARPRKTGAYAPVLATAAGVLAGVLVADALPPPAPPPMPVDETPTAWSCTADTLVTARECYLESEVKPSKDAAAQAKTNVQLAQSLAQKACSPSAKVRGESKADAELLAICQKEFVQAAESSCDLDGEVPLFDEFGRFAPQARSCYETLAAVLRKTRTMAALAVPCCRCLAKKCSPANECHQDIYEGDMPNGLDTCVAKGSCRTECRLSLPPPAPAHDGARTRAATGTGIEWL